MLGKTISLTKEKPRSIAWQDKLSKRRLESSLLHIAIVKNTFAIRNKSTKECLSFYSRSQKQNQIAKSEKFFCDRKQKQNKKIVAIL